MKQENCACGRELGPMNRTGRCRKCSSVRALAKPVPADFVEVAGRMSNLELMKFYSVGTGALARWRKETGISSPQKGGGVFKLVPAGFADLAPKLTRNELRKHFSCSVDTVDRWLRELGIKAMQNRPPIGRAAQHFNPKPAIVRRDDTPAGRAADYLRRYGPVVRCDPRGRYDPNGENWLRGSTVLAPQEVIERAQRLGWPA